MIDGGYAFIQYADCQTEVELANAEKSYWNYNTKTLMKQMIEDEGYQLIEQNQFMPGASYVIFRKPGKQNPFLYRASEITLD